MQELFMNIFLIIATCLLLITSVGLLKLPDLFTRMHGTTIAGTLGLTFILLALCVAMPEVYIITKALGTLLFIFIGAPVGAHMLGKAMFEKNYPFFSKKNSQE